MQFPFNAVKRKHFSIKVPAQQKVWNFFSGLTISTREANFT